MGLKPQASEKEIKLEYFKLAKKYHPDLNPDASARQKFEEVQKAYEVLSDTKKREEYDHQMGLGSAGQSQFERGMAKARAAAYSDDEYEDATKYQRGRQPKWDQPLHNEQDLGTENQERQRSFWEQSAKEGNRGKFDRDQQEDAKRMYEQQVFEEFDDFFNFSDNHHDPARDDTKGADLKKEVEIDFLDAVHGCTQEIEQDKRVVCLDCKGRRADMTKEPRKCYECGGRGAIIGNYGILKKCTKCDGASVQVKNYCPTCEGIGVVR